MGGECGSPTNYGAWSGCTTRRAPTCQGDVDRRLHDHRPAPGFAQVSWPTCCASGEAHRLGQRVAAHAHGKEGIARAVAAGVDTIEHCSFAGREFGSDFDPALAEEIAVAVILSAPRQRDRALMRERHGPVLEEVIMGLYQHGVPLIAGRRRHRQLPTAATSPGWRRWRRLAAGPRGAGGGHPGRYARSASGPHGSIAPGKDADLIAIRGDPLHDVSALHRIELVVRRGRQFIPARPSAARAAPSSAAAAFPTGRCTILISTPPPRPGPRPPGRPRQHPD